jgi:hypothetical protein
VAHAFNPSSREAEAGGPLNSLSVWSTGRATQKPCLEKLRSGVECGVWETERDRERKREREREIDHRSFIYLIFNVPFLFVCFIKTSHVPYHMHFQEIFCGKRIDGAN